MENKKEFSKFEIATIKRTAQSVNPMVTRKNKIAEQIVELQKEWDNLSAAQNQYEEAIKTMTGGFTTEDLVTKVIETTNAVDKNGKPIKVTKYVLKYPDTVIPPTTVLDYVEDIPQSNENMNSINFED